MTDRHYEIERTMTKTSTGDTVTSTTTGESSLAHKHTVDDDVENVETVVTQKNDNGDDVGRISASRPKSKPVRRKRRRTEGASGRTGIPRKTPRWTSDDDDEDDEESSDRPATDRTLLESSEKHRRENFKLNVSNESTNFRKRVSPTRRRADGNDDDHSRNNDDESTIQNPDKVDVDVDVDVDDNFVNEKMAEKEKSTIVVTIENPDDASIDDEPETHNLTRKPPMHPDASRRRNASSAGVVANRRDDSPRLRKTIQWLEEGARKLREDLAETRAELHEERRASRIARREIETAVREARVNEAAKHQRVIAELRTRLSQSPSCTTTDQNSTVTKSEYLKDENHRRELSAVKKRLAEADAMIRKLRSNSLESVNGMGIGKRRKIEISSSSELRKLDGEVKTLRAANKKLEDKLNMVCTEAEKIRTMELRIQHENHESELNALKKSLRSDTIRMMDEMRNKDREIEKLGRLARENRKSRAKHDDTMRKLRENENVHQIRLAARIDDKIPQVENGIDLFKSDCEAIAEVDRLRELAVEQQEFIEVLRQAVKEKERKLDQLSNKKRKEEFYKQWLELEPVAEVDDEEEHEEGDSALSSAPSSLSPQPGGCGHWQTNGVTREAYEAVIIEFDEIQTKYLEEQQELIHAKSQVRDLEKALLQETRGSQNSRRALSEKLRKLEERETGLLAEISELREQNELLEFRVLELEESPGSRETPDNADSGIVSPEPINIFKQEQNNKQRDRAVATVLPFSSYTHPTSPIPMKKPPLSLQESGIFEDDDDDDEDDVVTDDEMEAETSLDVEFTSCGTQTEAPVGELLQEVQRLHELRERIQERAVKVPSNTSHEINESKIEEDKSFYREKIRELEEILAERDEDDAKRTKDDFVAKQREEDLLDENYRLTERVYWLENELRRCETDKKILVNVETMTDEKNLSIDVSTMTEVDRSFPTPKKMIDHGEQTSEVETMERMKIYSERIPEEYSSIKENFCTASSEISSLVRCENIYQTTLRDNWVNEETPRMSKMDVDGSTIEPKLREPSRINEDNVDACADCASLRRDYDERVRRLGQVECRFRGRMSDLDRKEGALVETLKRVDDTWSQLEADHAKKLEEIGRRLEEKVMCNRRIMKRVAELEMIERSEENKKRCSCECGISSLASIDHSISSSIISDDVERMGLENNDSLETDEADGSMDVDVDDRVEESQCGIKVDGDVHRTTQTEDDYFECVNCGKNRERICNENSEILRDVEADGLTKKTFEPPIFDGSTETAIEAKEENDENSTTTIEAETRVSRIRLLPEDDTPIPEFTETRSVTINETEIDKKVRDRKRRFGERFGGEGVGWVTKNWNVDSCNPKGGSERCHETDSKTYTIFSHAGVHYVIYPEICV